MKRLASLLVVGLCVLLISSSAFAGYHGSGDKHGKGKGYMHAKMMKMMMDKTIVATKDGGVVVMIGNKLLKYDKNLNLKKEVEIEVDFEQMFEKMKEMKGKCPYEKMKEEKSASEEE